MFQFFSDYLAILRFIAGAKGTHDPRNRYFANAFWTSMHVCGIVATYAWAWYYRPKTSRPALQALKKVLINDSKSRLVVPIFKIAWLVLFRTRGRGQRLFLQIVNGLVNFIWWGAFAAYGL